LNIFFFQCDEFLVIEYFEIKFDLELEGSDSKRITSLFLKTLQTQPKIMFDVSKTVMC